MTMNDSQFNKKINSLLKDIPKEFHSLVTGLSWEQGHSSGHSNVLEIADDIVVFLLPCIEKYKKSLLPNE